jgi:hypothetical protein
MFDWIETIKIETCPWSRQGDEAPADGCYSQHAGWRFVRWRSIRNLWS